MLGTDQLRLIEPHPFRNHLQIVLLKSQSQSKQRHVWNGSAATIFFLNAAAQ
jgi:hypothetical protein